MNSICTPEIKALLFISLHKTSRHLNVVKFDLLYCDIKMHSWGMNILGPNSALTNRILLKQKPGLNFAF